MVDSFACPPLDVAAVRAALCGLVARLDVVPRTGSTNADLAARAASPSEPITRAAPSESSAPMASYLSPSPDRSGEVPDRTVLVAEVQDAGRGRLDRRWVSPPGAGLTFSVLLRPAEVPPARRGWLPLLAGVALLRAVRAVAPGVPAWTKWPNDLLLGPERRKAAGVLVEAVGDAVVVGIGMNVRTRAADLPPGVNATSLLVEGADVRREDVLVALLRALLADEANWRAAGGDPERAGLAEAYRAGCATLGERVRVEQAGSVLSGVATGIDDGGRLLVRDPAGATRVLAAGDVVHVR